MPALIKGENWDYRGKGAYSLIDILFFRAYILRMKFYSALLFLLILACSDPSDTPFDNPPEILSIQAPSVVAVDDTLRVRAYDEDGDAIQISLSVQASNGHTIAGALSKPFSDDGTGGDRIAADGIFTAVLDQNAFLSESASQFEITLTPYETDHNQGEAHTIIIMQNPSQGHQPVISNLTAPDVVHTGQVTSFVLSVMVTDPDGLSDIASVTRVNVTVNGQPRSLNDAGTNGDATSADGIYTETISVSPAPAPGSYLFRVQATDLLGLKSNSLEKTIVIQN